MENTVEFVSNSIKEEFVDEFLVKPLDPIKVKKEFSKPIVKETIDDDGLEVSDYEEIDTEIKEVESDFIKGVVLKTPIRTDGIDPMNKNFKINVGDTVIFHRNTMRHYDLIKDSVLLKIFNIIAVERC